MALSSLNGRLKVQNEPKGLFAAHELNSAELTYNKLTQLHDAFVIVTHSRASASRLHFILISCRETRAVSSQHMFVSAARSSGVAIQVA